MRSHVDPLGRLLLRSGALPEHALTDVLDHQRHTLPFGSLCYVLGHLPEEQITRGLSKQFGVPGVVLDLCVIDLAVLEGVPREQALTHGVLPVYEDERRAFVAMQNPRGGRDFLREIEFVKGKAVVPHIALHVTLARTIRVAYAALARGDTHWIGPLVERRGGATHGEMFVVSDVDSISPDAPEARAHEIVVEDITKEVFESDLVQIIEAGEESAGYNRLRTARSATTLGGGPDTALGAGAAGVPPNEPDTPVNELDTPIAPLDGAIGRESTPVSEVELAPATEGRVINLDDGDGVERRPERAGPPRVLIVDDDFATRHLLVKMLQPSGYVTATAASGSEAVRLIKGDPPDLVVIDVMLPEIDGFQICRAIKQSRRYNHIPVVLMSAVIDSGRVTDQVLQRYGADAYFEKPLNTDRIRRRIADLIGSRAAQSPVVHDNTFEQSLAMYRAGQIDEAIGLLRTGLKDDPLSAKHHFVLANLLQKKALLYEAIDEYEATVDLKPDYFPALTRLAYLYYKKGFSAKAIETWRRSLPYCPDPDLRHNIEVFMRKLIADMQAEG
jgi:CheY-like chemotaxis protein